MLASSLQVIFRWWKITHRSAEVQRLHPGEIKECYEDFLHDDRTQCMFSHSTYAIHKLELHSLNQNADILVLTLRKSLLIVIG